MHNCICLVCILIRLLSCKNRLPYNLYCVGGDVKHCTIQSNAYAAEIVTSNRLTSDVWMFQLRQSGKHVCTFVVGCECSVHIFIASVCHDIVNVISFVYDTTAGFEVIIC